MHGDEVPDRFHWPIQATLSVNRLAPASVPFRSRLPLRRSGRDPAVSIGPLCHEGANRIDIRAVDARDYFLVVRIEDACQRPRQLHKRTRAPALLLPPGSSSAEAELRRTARVC